MQGPFIPAMRPGTVKAKASDELLEVHTKAPTKYIYIKNPMHPLDPKIGEGGGKWVKL